MESNSLKCQFKSNGHLLDFNYCHNIFILLNFYKTKHLIKKLIDILKKVKYYNSHYLALFFMLMRGSCASTLIIMT